MFSAFVLELAFESDLHLRGILIKLITPCPTYSDTVNKVIPNLHTNFLARAETVQVISCR